MTAAQELTKELEQRSNEVTALTTLWKSGVDTYCPDAAQLGLWLELHPFAIVRYGIKETARKFLRKQKQMDAQYLVKFASSVMNAEHSRQAAA